MDNMNALFDLLTKSELVLELDAAMLELDAHAAKIAAKAREIERLRAGLEEIAAAADNGDCYCEVGEGYHAIECPVAIAGIARAILAQKEQK
jgi:hypothetical protein